VQEKQPGVDSGIYPDNDPDWFWLQGGLLCGWEQIFGQGHPGQEPGGPGKIQDMVTHMHMPEGHGMTWDAGQLHPQLPTPPVHMTWEGYMSNYLDQSAASLFANAKHASNKKVNLLSIIRTHAVPASEGRDSTSTDASWGVGVRSLDIFELNSNE